MASDTNTTRYSRSVQNERFQAHMRLKVVIMIVLSADFSCIQIGRHTQATEQWPVWTMLAAAGQSWAASAPSEAFPNFSQRQLSSSSFSNMSLYSRVFSNSLRS